MSQALRPYVEMAAYLLELRSGSSRLPPTWEEIARPEQRLPAGEWRSWLILAGRGWGKTRTGAEAVSEWVRTGWHGASRWWRRRPPMRAT